MLNQNNTPQPNIPATLAFWLSDLQGYIKTIAVNPIGEPTFTPKSFDQSIRIVVDSLSSPTSRRLYIYSFELGDWLYVALST